MSKQLYSLNFVVCLLVVSIFCFSMCNHISLMLIGNQVVQIPKTNIAKAGEERQSLMYENLIKNLSKEEVDHLLDYIVSLR